MDQCLVIVTELEYTEATAGGLETKSNRHRLSGGERGWHGSCEKHVPPCGVPNI